MTIEELYIKNLKDRINDFFNIDENNIVFEDGDCYLGILDGCYLYFNKFKIKVSNGLRGRSFVIFNVKDSKITDITIPKEKPRKLRVMSDGMVCAQKYFKNKK